MDSQCAKEGEPPIGADQWDVDSWNNLASEADQGHFATVRPKYERLVTQFPAMGKFWRMYAEHMVRENNDKDDDIIELYNRAVIDAPTSIELWHSFNKYMAARAAKNPGSLPHEAQANAVHERALSSAGLDIKANVLWSQHFNFLMNQATMSDSQRRESLRRLHQRAVMLLHFIFFAFLFLASFRASQSTCFAYSLSTLPSIPLNEKKNLCPRAGQIAGRHRSLFLTLAFFLVEFLRS